MVALIFAVWRGVVAHRQSVTAERQAETALRQSETAQQGLLNERYQKGGEMLGSEVLSVRLGGIYGLQRLAEEHPEQYHILVMRLLCAFVRLPPANDGTQSNPQTHEGQSEQILELRSDVQDAMKTIALRGSAGILMESSREDNTLYLRDARLTGLQLRNANLSKAWLTNANLSRAVLPYVDLSNSRLRLVDFSSAELRHSDLSNAVFWGANFSGAVLWQANLSGSDFCGAGARSASYRIPARGLTQAQLDQAWADIDNPPKLEGVLDAETGEQLVWRGTRLDDDA
ncbi:MAG: pentapeptide repeat-containing protein [Rhodospirillaceae bacterium]|nr:pentapeptide repeat-containing protein [Rhodospirillaceae bacterium]